MPTSQAKDAENKAAYEEYRRKQEEAELSFVRTFVDAARLWRACENRECRRARGCRDAGACRRKHAEDILWWQRNVFAPYLRERYPTVQWGAPAAVVEPQYEAALAAEREREEAGRGRQAPEANARAHHPRRACAERHPLYSPPDFSGGQQNSDGPAITVRRAGVAGRGRCQRTK